MATGEGRSCLPTLVKNRLKLLEIHKRCFDLYDWQKNGPIIGKYYCQPMYYTGLAVTVEEPIHDLIGQERIFVAWASLKVRAY